MQKKGYLLVQSNYCIRYGEIDLIFRDKDVLVFVEAKTKTSDQWGTPEEMFTRYKYRQVKRTAQAYLQGKEVPCRIDMIAVMLDANMEPADIRHYENVVLE